MDLSMSEQFKLNYESICGLQTVQFPCGELIYLGVWVESAPNDMHTFRVVQRYDYETKNWRSETEKVSLDEFNRLARAYLKSI